MAESGPAARYSGLDPRTSYQTDDLGSRHDLVVFVCMPDVYGPRDTLRENFEQQLARVKRQGTRDGLGSTRDRPRSSIARDDFDDLSSEHEREAPAYLGEQLGR